MSNKDRRRKRFWGVSLVALALALLAPALMAEEKAGASVIVNKNDGESVRGELLAVQNNSLILMDESTLTGVTVDIADVRNVKVLKKGNFLTGFGLGFVAGAALSAISSNKTEGSSYASTNESSGINFSLQPSALSFGLIGGFIGGVIGGNYKQKIEFAGKSVYEIHINVVRLHKLARIQS